MVLYNKSKNPTYLSNEASEVLFNKIRELDKLLDTQQKRIHDANASIVLSVKTYQDIWAERSKLALELGRQTSPDWQPEPVNESGAMSKASHTDRFFRPNAYPAINLSLHISPDVKQGNDDFEDIDDDE